MSIFFHPVINSVLIENEYLKLDTIQFCLHEYNNAKYKVHIESEYGRYNLKFAIKHVENPDLSKNTICWLNTKGIIILQLINFDYGTSPNNITSDMHEFAIMPAGRFYVDAFINVANGGHRAINITTNLYFKKEEIEWDYDDETKA